jgi:hypothetical protein
MYLDLGVFPCVAFLERSVVWCSNSNLPGVLDIHPDCFC